MKKINFKEKKYIIPLIIIPFLIGFFYLYNDMVKHNEEAIIVVDNEIRGINNVSSTVQEASLKTKLEAYEEGWKEAKGVTAIQSLGTEQEEEIRYTDLYTDEEKEKIAELEELLKQRDREALAYQNSNSNNQGYVAEDPFEKYVQQQERLNKATQQSNYQEVQEDQNLDPVQMMKDQFALMDSINEARTPEAIAARKKELLDRKKDSIIEARNLNKLTVQRKEVSKYGFNTIKKEKDHDFIKAIIDENVQGYAGSRIRIRLLEDILIDKELIKKGTYLYASISGFSEQRVTLSITGLMYKNRILPINLSIYDIDGMEGLYVPASQFREFTKELGGNTLQGQAIEGGEQGDFLMSTTSKIFQSTSNAIAAAIRKNKVKLKYNSYIYLIDKEDLTNNK